MMVVSKTSSSPSELQIALDNRAFEIQLFWQRSNYFMVLMTALGIGAFAIKEPKYALLVSIFASMTSWFWYKTNLGSKFWHESWEVEVVNLAKEQGIRSFERPMPDVIDQVRNSLEDAANYGKRSRLRQFLDRQILKKPSVSHYMILLSLTSTILWGVVSTFQLYDLARAENVFPGGSSMRVPAAAKTSSTTDEKASISAPRQLPRSGPAASSEPKRDRSNEEAEGDGRGTKSASPYPSSSNRLELP